MMTEYSVNCNVRHFPAQGNGQVVVYGLVDRWLTDFSSGNVLAGRGVW